MQQQEHQQQQKRNGPQALLPTTKKTQLSFPPAWGQLTKSRVATANYNKVTEWRPAIFFLFFCVSFAGERFNGE